MTVRCTLPDKFISWKFNHETLDTKKITAGSSYITSLRRTTFYLSALPGNGELTSDLKFFFTLNHNGSSVSCFGDRKNQKKFLIINQRYSKLLHFHYILFIFSTISVSNNLK